MVADMREKEIGEWKLGYLLFSYRLRWGWYWNGMSQKRVITVVETKTRC